MISMIFEAIEVLVALPTDFASMWFRLFHAQRARVGAKGFWVNNGEGAIFVGG